MTRVGLLLVGVLALSSCNKLASHAPTGPGGARDFGPTAQSGDGSALGTPDDLLMSLPDDAGPVAGGGVYGDLGKGDSGMCAAPQTGMTCPSPRPDGCLTVEDCGPTGKGNGLDDDCNGVVDETCICTPGDVEPCFMGPPGKRNVGACTDGTQTCGGGEFPRWGACHGSIGPSPEVCDKLDNDCNGCPDDGLCCDSALDCPAPGDPRIAPQPPYTDVPLKGELFYPGMNAASWSWTVTGGPCDQLFAVTTGNPPHQSFTLTGATMKDALAHFTLSGDYTVTLTVVDTSGHTFTCTWVQHIIGPGVRFELCWDKTGSSPNGADIDLHVHRSGTTTTWFGPSTSAPNNDDCNYDTCTSNGWTANWNYVTSPIAVCSGAPNAGGWTNGCGNPRLDIDNIREVGRPENINVDKPANADSFRAMVHYYGQDGSTSKGHLEVHPIVNVYCGGTLKATYGQAPNTLGPCPGPTCFDFGSGWNAGQMWRVADVQAQVDAAGNTTGCNVTALHPPGTTAGYYVTTGNSGY